MTKEEVKAIRSRTKFDMRSFASCLGIPVTTYQRYENGTAAVPVAVAQAVVDLEIRLKQQDAERDAVMCALVDKQYPNGIASEL